MTCDYCLGDDDHASACPAVTGAFDMWKRGADLAMYHPTLSPADGADPTFLLGWFVYQEKHATS